MQALHRMREYERRLDETVAESSNAHGASPAAQHQQRSSARNKSSDATSSSAQDQGSDDSVSDVPVSLFSFGSER